MLKGNKGEWSELYVFTKILAEGKLYQSDINLMKDDEYYEVLKAYREEATCRLEYSRDDKISLYNKAISTLPIDSFNLDYFQKNTTRLFNGILKGKGKSFAIEDVQDFIDKLKIGKLTALSTNKADIILRIYDHRLAKETDLGFSIKSLLGKNSTLLNTGSGNNFIYNIISQDYIDIKTFNEKTYKPDKGTPKITARLQSLINNDCRIEFDQIQSKQFWRNLKMVDGDLPEILSYLLLYRYQFRENSIFKLSALLEKNDPLNFYEGDIRKQKLYEYKIKRLLVECAMGMTSEKVWEGVYDATGGVIVAKKDGDIVCFHIYDFNLFRDYLINNTVLEQASTGEDELNPGKERTTKGTKKYYYGWLYEENLSLKFKINLQIRFK